MSRIPLSPPSALFVNIDRRGGFGSMPTSRKLDMGCRRSGHPTLFFKSDNKSQASSLFLTPPSLPPPLPVNIDRRGVFRSMPTSRKLDMGCRRSGHPTLFFKTDNKSQASSLFLTPPSLPPPLPVNIDRRGVFRSMNSSKHTLKNKQATLFSPRARSRHPSSSISIDREGFRACPHPESRIWAALTVAGGAAASCR
jgi:hypothetical protein